MAQPRFFVDADLTVGQPCRLPQSAAHHAQHVLRLRGGDAVVLFNGRGGEFGAVLAGGVEADVVSFVPVERESPLAVTLVQAWIATEKLDWTVEKAVELGAARIVMAAARRSVVALSGTRLERRLQRLRDIAIAACCQCGRNRVPPIDAFPAVPSALAAARSEDASGLMLHPNAADGLASVATGVRSIAVAIGPEGGFDDSEVEAGVRLGYRLVRLGPRVLRTETAGLAALAALQVTSGDMRSPAAG